MIGNAGWDVTFAPGTIRFEWLGRVVDLFVVLEGICPGCDGELVSGYCIRCRWRWSLEQVGERWRFCGDPLPSPERTHWRFLR